MPHKKNPVLSENLTGIARVIRSSCIPFMENISLWHERDISHSSVERTLGPDSITLCDFALSRMNDIVENLVVDTTMMIKNIEKTNGLYNSQRVMLKLIEKNISREAAYKTVQKIALKAWKENQSFKKLLEKNKEVKSFLNAKEINDLFDLKYFLKNINKIYKKIFG